MWDSRRCFSRRVICEGAVCQGTTSVVGADIACEKVMTASAGRG